MALGIRLDPVSEANRQPDLKTLGKLARVFLFIVIHSLWMRLAPNKCKGATCTYRVAHILWVRVAPIGAKDSAWKR